MKAPVKDLLLNSHVLSQWAAWNTYQLYFNMIHWDINFDPPKTIIYYQAGFLRLHLFNNKNPAFLCLANTQGSILSGSVMDS